MTNPTAKALLPAGLSDVLPPEAEREQSIVQALMAAFARFGYQRVKPPLIEYEDSLLSGSGASLTQQTFRLMDPVSQRMMGLRPDMTMQIARIATTRLARAPRPLRLSYGGQVLRVSGSHQRPERQFGQVGAELVGSASHHADVEVILMAVAALRSAGVAAMTVDLAVPTLVPAVMASFDVPASTANRLRAALERKDAAAVAEVSSGLGPASSLFSDLLAASGAAEPALEALNRLDLPDAAARERAVLARVAAGVRAGEPDLPMTVDATEHRGWEYHTGVTFTVFAPGVRGELGSGGRYRAAPPGSESDAEAEDATGLTLFMDTLLRALPPAEDPDRLYLPAGTDVAVARAWRDKGWIAVAAIDDGGDPLAEASRLGCSHMLTGGEAKPVTAGENKG